MYINDKVLQRTFHSLPEDVSIYLIEKLIAYGIKLEYLEKTSIFWLSKHFLLVIFVRLILSIGLAWRKKKICG